MVPDVVFFETQLRFAERWATLAAVPVETAILDCTTWYRQAAGLGREFDPDEPQWRRFLSDVTASREPAAVVHAWAAANEPEVLPGPVLDYAWLPDEVSLRIHFMPERRPDQHPLADATLPERRHELRDLVTRGTAEHPDAAWLRGRSWLYGLEAYRRIFPQGFLRELAIEAPDLQFLAIWGQLLDRRWKTRADVAARLLAAVKAASSTEDLEAAFPIPMRQARLPIDEVVSALDEQGEHADP